MKHLTIISLLITLMMCPPAYAKDNELRTPIPGVTVELLPAKRIGEGVMIPLRWKNESGSDFQILIGYRGVGDDATYAVLDNGKKVYLDIDNNRPETKSGIPHLSYLWIDKADGNVKQIDTIIIEGRAPNSPKSTDTNYYGEYAYTLTNIPVPGIQFGPTSKSAFLNPDFTLGQVKATKADGNLILEYTLTNNTSDTKELAYYNSNDAAYAYDTNGKKYRLTTSAPKEYPAGVPVKVTTTINGAADVETFSAIMFPFSDSSLPWGDCYFKMWNYTPGE